MDTNEQQEGPEDPRKEELPRLDIFIATEPEVPDDTVDAALEPRPVRIAQADGPPQTPRSGDSAAQPGADQPQVIAYAKPEMEAFIASPDPDRQLPQPKPKPSRPVRRGHRRRSVDRHERITTQDSFGQWICTCDQVCVCIPVCTCDTVPVCSCVSYRRPPRCRRHGGGSGGGYGCLCVPVCRCVPVAH